MDDWPGKIFNATTGVWAIFCGLMVALFKAWPAVMGRINERHRDRENEEAGSHARLLTEIERLDGRCDHLQKEVDDCREREGEWMKRAIAAEAYQIGRGTAANEVTILETSKRAEGNGDGNA